MSTAPKPSAPFHHPWDVAESRQSPQPSNITVCSPRPSIPKNSIFQVAVEETQTEFYYSPSNEDEPDESPSPPPVARFFQLEAEEATENGQDEDEDDSDRAAKRLPSGFILSTCEDENTSMRGVNDRKRSRMRVVRGNNVDVIGRREENAGIEVALCGDG